MGERWTDYDKEKNIIAYHGHFGQLSGDGKGQIRKKGVTKIKVGDVITVRTQLETGNIEWVINGQLEEAYLMENLKDSSIVWVPYILVWNKNTQIYWID